ncbi:MAG: zinc-ribbon domain-containing protein [Eubacterium sp.]|nr:zinc-ribbon domain-containing protein [Eubacterium sp.]
MPDLVKEWDYDKNDIDPTEVTVGSTKEIWWKCKYGHEWKRQIYEMAIKKSSVRCPICYKSNCKRG